MLLSVDLSWKTNSAVKSYQVKQIRYFLISNKLPHKVHLIYQDYKAAVVALVSI